MKTHLLLTLVAAIAAPFTKTVAIEQVAPVVKEVVVSQSETVSASTACAVWSLEKPVLSDWTHEVALAAPPTTYGALHAPPRVQFTQVFGVSGTYNSATLGGSTDEGQAAAEEKVAGFAADQTATCRFVLEGTCYGETEVFAGIVTDIK